MVARTFTNAVCVLRFTVRTFTGVVCAFNLSARTNTTALLRIRCFVAPTITAHRAACADLIVGAWFTHGIVGTRLMTVRTQVT